MLAELFASTKLLMAVSSSFNFIDRGCVFKKQAVTSRRWRVGTQQRQVLVFLSRGPPEIDPRWLDQSRSRRFIPGVLGGEEHPSFAPESDYSASDPWLSVWCRLMQIR